MALQLYLVIPWAIGLFYSQLRGRRMAKTAANGFLLVAMLALTATCVYREDFDMPPMAGADRHGRVRAGGVSAQRRARAAAA